MSVADGAGDLRAVLAAPFDDAVVETRRALHDHGFGVLTEIDVRSTLVAKLGEGAAEGVGPFRILGACRPQLAREALLVDPAVGTFLPCNVVIRTEGVRTVVEAADPRAMVELADNLALTPVAARVRRLLVDVVADVARTYAGEVEARR